MSMSVCIYIFRSRIVQPRVVTSLQAGTVNSGFDYRLRKRLAVAPGVYTVSHAVQPGEFLPYLSSRPGIDFVTFRMRGGNAATQA